MKKIFWMLLLTFGASRLFAQTVVSFNFSGDPATTSGWINVSGDPSVAVRKREAEYKKLKVEQETHPVNSTSGNSNGTN